jgi:hypothetical protein
MHAAASTVGSGHGQASASTHDVFTLLGPAAAPPITFHAHAIVRTGIYCGYGDVAQAYASISDGAFEGAGIAGSTDSCLVTTDLPISISRASGSTFDIYLTVSATAGSGDIFAYGSDGSASLRLTFPDLPAGYSLVSCQGFGAGVTAAKRSSWGALKARYR